MAWSTEHLDAIDRSTTNQSNKICEVALSNKKFKTVRHVRQGVCFFSVFNRPLHINGCL